MITCMASPSGGAGACSGSSQIQSSGSEEDLRQIMDQRKRKRMISNRESARRSRMRKQNHLDELVSQAGQLREENSFIITSVKVTTQLCMNVEAENSVLRAQVTELTHRLNSLNEIIDCLNSNKGVFEGSDDQDFAQMINSDDLLNPWDSLYLNQPIMASADVFMY